MAHSFSATASANIQRSSFDRSFGHKTTFDAGQLIPIYHDEALPGDTFHLSMTGFGRMATPIYPIMDNLYLDTHFFAVPYRLVWDNWQKFNGEQLKPGDSTDYTVPQLQPTTVQSNSLYDYFGLPINVTYATSAGNAVNSLFFRAYNLIFNEWYRDENLVDPVTVPTGDGPDDPALFNILNRGKRHDYFTSCLPWPQKGEAVDIPIGTRAPVKGIALQGGNSGQYPYSNVPQMRESDGSVRTYASAAVVSDAQNLNPTAFYVEAGDAVGSVVPPNIYADLSEATAATINQLREAFQVQALLERDARSGTRYTEIILSHFGVRSPDSRLQRPEYLGGGSSMVNVNAIAQTSSTNETSPQGNLAAMGTIRMSGHGFGKSFVEHCLVIGIASIRADLSYQKGLNRHWSRQTRYDFYWPTLSHLGEQAVYNKELYCYGTAGDFNNVFGYQERYSEYRYMPSMITGLFRSEAAGTLDSWHLAQNFESLPALNSSFITENVPVDRVIAVKSEPQFIFDSWFKYRCARPLPMYATPVALGRF